MTEHSRQLSMCETEIAGTSSCAIENESGSASVNASASTIASASASASSR